MRKSIALILLTIILIFILTGCKSDKTDDMEAKIKDEIGYLDVKIIEMLNKINNISYENYKVTTQEIELNKDSGKSGDQTATSQEPGQRDKGEQGESQGETKETQTINKSEMSYSSVLTKENQEINWDILKSEIEVLHSTWNTIIIDLMETEIDSQFITSFEQELDQTTIFIKNENKQDSLNGLGRMYSCLPEFIENENGKSIINVKKHLINAYSICENKQWNEMENEVNNAISIIKNVSNENEFNLEKSKVVLMEVLNAIAIKDIDVFYIKYRNAIEQLEIL